MIKIEQGESSPFVEVNEANNSLTISGNSFVSDPHKFYSRLIEWSNTFYTKENGTFQIKITLGYYSTSNIQSLNLVLKNLDKNNPQRVEVTFYLTEEEEEDLEETILSLVFNTKLKYSKEYLET